MDPPRCITPPPPLLQETLDPQTLLLLSGHSSRIGAINQHCGRYNLPRPPPWTSAETQHLVDIIEDREELDIASVQDRTGQARPSGPTYCRSPIEIYDRYLVLCVLYAARCPKPFVFLQHGGSARKKPLSNPWKVTRDSYHRDMERYHCVGSGVPTLPGPPRNLRSISDRKLCFALSALLEYVAFYDHYTYLPGSTSCSPGPAPPEPSTTSRVLEQLQFSHPVPELGYWNSRLPFPLESRSCFLHCKSLRPSDGTAPIDCTLHPAAILEAPGSTPLDRPSYIRLHYAALSTPYSPWTYQETQHILSSLTDAGQTDLCQLQVELTRRADCDCRYHHRSLIELHDTCLLLRALRAVGIDYELALALHGNHPLGAANFATFLKHCTPYTNGFLQLNGLDPMQSPCDPSFAKAQQAATHAPSLAFRILQDYSTFYANSRGILDREDDSDPFPYELGDLQHLAYFEI